MESLAGVKKNESQLGFRQGMLGRDSNRDRVTTKDQVTIKGDGKMDLRGKSEFLQSTKTGCFNDVS